MSEAAEDIERPRAARRQRPKGSTWLFLLGALVGLGVSINTSWRYFDLKMGIHDPVERVSMFAGMEIVLLACGVAMFEAARDPKAKAGPAKALAWTLCAVSAFAALQLAGGLVGPMRVILGPVLALVSLHRALGIEMRAGGHERTGTLAKVGREVREQLLSLLGLGDDGRDAVERRKARTARRAERRKARAARRYAHLVRAGGLVPFRKARMARAMKAANVAHDEVQRARVLAELQMLEHAETLRDLQQVSPWQVATVADVPVAEVATVAEPVANVAAVPVAEVAEPVANVAEQVATVADVPVATADVPVAEVAVPVAEVATVAEPVAEVADMPVAAAELQQQARERYRQSVAAKKALSGEALGAEFGRSGRWGRAQIAAARTEAVQASGTVVSIKAGSGRRG